MAEVALKEKQSSTLSVQWKRRLGRRGLFAIRARSERMENPGAEETIMTLTATEAITLGGILVSEGNIKLKEIANAGS